VEKGRCVHTLEDHEDAVLYVTKTMKGELVSVGEVGEDED